MVDGLIQEEFIDKVWCQFFLYKTIGYISILKPFLHHSGLIKILDLVNRKVKITFQTMVKGILCLMVYKTPLLVFNGI